VFSVLRFRLMCSYAKLFDYADAELCKGSKRATLSSDGINFSVKKAVWSHRYSVANPLNGIER